MVTDVVIVGGGLVGGTLAVALASQGINTVVIDQEDPADWMKSADDGRTTAVSYGSKQMLEQLGIWEKVSENAEPVLHIRVFEQNASPGTPWVVNYDHKDLGSLPMGYIVENRFLRQAIFQRAGEIPLNLSWRAPLKVSHTQRNLAGTNIHLEDGQILHAALLVGAEGRLSPTREEAGVKARRWNYGQMALVAHTFHEKPHGGSAWEIFQPEGPFAILPLKKCLATGKHRSGIVWTGSPAYINNLSGLDDQELSCELAAIFPYFGSIELSGKRWSYPLSAMVAQEITGLRLAIVGDAAHIVHPVAGQGVNLGWRDAQALAGLLGKSRQLGMDLGLQGILKAYQRQRRVDTLSVLAMTDGMVRMFSNQSSILYFLRNAGLGMVNQLPFLKRRLMRRAMGI